MNLSNKLIGFKIIDNQFNIYGFVFKYENQILGPYLRPSMNSLFPHALIKIFDVVNEDVKYACDGQTKSFMKYKENLMIKVAKVFGFSIKKRLESNTLILDISYNITSETKLNSTFKRERNSLFESLFGNNIFITKQLLEKMLLCVNSDPNFIDGLIINFVELKKSSYGELYLNFTPSDPNSMVINSQFIGEKIEIQHENINMFKSWIGALVGLYKTRQVYYYALQMGFKVDYENKDGFLKLGKFDELSNFNRDLSIRLNYRDNYIGEFNKNVNKEIVKEFLYYLSEYEKTYQKMLCGTTLYEIRSTIKLIWEKILSKATLMGEILVGSMSKSFEATYKTQIPTSILEYSARIYFGEKIKVKEYNGLNPSEIYDYIIKTAEDEIKKEMMIMNANTDIKLKNKQQDMINLNYKQLDPKINLLTEFNIDTMNDTLVKILGKNPQLKQSKFFEKSKKKNETDIKDNEKVKVIKDKKKKKVGENEKVIKDIKKEKVDKGENGDPMELDKAEPKKHVNTNKSTLLELSKKLTENIKVICDELSDYGSKMSQDYENIFIKEKEEEFKFDNITVKILKNYDTIPFKLNIVILNDTKTVKELKDLKVINLTNMTSEIVNFVIGEIMFNEKYWKSTDFQFDNFYYILENIWKINNLPERLKLKKILSFINNSKNDDHHVFFKSFVKYQNQKQKYYIKRYKINDKFILYPETKIELLNLLDKMFEVNVDEAKDILKLLIPNPVAYDVKSLLVGCNEFLSNLFKNYEALIDKTKDYNDDKKHKLKDLFLALLKEYEYEFSSDVPSMDTVASKIGTNHNNLLSENIETHIDVSTKSPGDSIILSSFYSYLISYGYVMPDIYHLLKYFIVSHMPDSMNFIVQSDTKVNNHGNIIKVLHRFRKLYIPKYYKKEHVDIMDMNSFSNYEPVIKLDPSLKKSSKNEKFNELEVSILEDLLKQFYLKKIDNKIIRDNIRYYLEKNDLKLVISSSPHYKTIIPGLKNEFYQLAPRVIKIGTPLDNYNNWEELINVYKSELSTILGTNHKSKMFALLNLNEYPFDQVSKYMKDWDKKDLIKF